MIRFLSYPLFVSFVSLSIGEAAGESLPKQNEATAEPINQNNALDPKLVKKTTQDDQEKKRSTIIDARRLAGEFNDTILYIKGHPEARFKLTNVTIDFGETMTMLHSLQEAQVLDRFDAISFVMTDKNHMTLDENVFMSNILPHLSSMQELELHCWGVSDKVVSAISEKMPRLTSLFLFGTSITDTTMDVLVEKLPHLKKLHLVNTNLTEKGAEKIDGAFKHLDVLGISGKNLEDNDLVVLVEGMKNLHTLSVNGQTFKSLVTIDELIEAASKVKSFDLSETNVTDGEIKAIIDTMKNLEDLTISDTPITKDGIKEIAEGLSLTTLKMDDMKAIGDEELKFVASHQEKLEKFHFSGADFSDFGIMDVIQNLPELQDVTLVPNADSKWILTDAVAAALSHNLKKLKYLRIEAKRLPDGLRKYLSQNMPNTYIEYE